MKRTTILGLVLVSALAAACSPPPQAPAGETTTSAPVEHESATPAEHFAQRAAMYERYQIEAARLAAANSPSAAVKAYAATAEQEHSAALASLNEAARASGLAEQSGAPDDDYNAYLDMLRRPENFDVNYASQQALTAMSASGLYDSFTSTAPDSPLKQWATAQAQHVHDGVGAARRLAGEIQH